MSNLPKKLTIRHRFLGGEYLEDEKGNKIEIKRSFFGNDKWIEIGGERIYFTDDEKILVRRGICSDTEIYERKEGFISTYYEKKTLCLISTVCVKEMNLPDDCIELETLRKFRRKYLLDKSAGKRLLIEYERISPKIVEWIELQKDQRKILIDLYNQLVYPTVEMIQKGYVERPVYHYLRIINKLKELSTKTN